MYVYRYVCMYIYIYIYHVYVSQAHRGFPGSVESSNVSRDNVSVGIGRSSISYVGAMLLVSVVVLVVMYL